MKPFWDNLVLDMKKYLCSFNDSLPNIDSISNEQVLSGTSKYNYYHNQNLIYIWMGYS